MTNTTDVTRFQHLDYEGFRKLAVDSTLSPNEKIGFPNSYREGKEADILLDIQGKLTNLHKHNQVVLDIGPGCSDLALKLIELCASRDDTLIMVDSPEMLRFLPSSDSIIKIPAYYPKECEQLFVQWSGGIDAILSYSVLHYVFDEGNIFDFFDRSLSLLAPGGQMLIGDIPNVNKRKRFFDSENGIRFHQQYMGTTEIPVVEHNKVEQGQIDDSVIVSLVLRARSAGFDGYWLPQAVSLPMANRREDILILRP